MKDKTVTITSKNQITLPSKFVRNLQLQKGSRLTVKMRGSALTLKPAPAVEDIMAPVWREMKKHVKRPLTDEELRQAARVAYAAQRPDKT